MRKDNNNQNLHLQQHHLSDRPSCIAMIPVKAPPIMLCTALYIIFIGNNLLIPLMNLTYNLLFKPFFMEVKPMIIIRM